jgi:hypothetical protein
MTSMIDSYEREFEAAGLEKPSFILNRRTPECCVDR